MAKKGPEKKAGEKKGKQGNANTGEENQSKVMLTFRVTCRQALG